MSKLKAFKVSFRDPTAVKTETGNLNDIQSRLFFIVNENIDATTAGFNNKTKEIK